MSDRRDLLARAGEPDPRGTGIRPDRPLTTGEGSGLDKTPAELLAEMRAFALTLPDDLGPLFGRDVARMCDECGRLREQLDAANARIVILLTDFRNEQLTTRHLREQLDAARQALDALATSLEQKVAGNKQGPDMGWTHPDEPADQLRREVGYVIEDARAALGGCPLSDRPLTGEGAAAARARAEAWLAGLVRRDMTASIATATDLARDVVALTDELLEGD